MLSWTLAITWPIKRSFAWRDAPTRKASAPSVSSPNFLGKLLYDHIRSEFPTLVQDIRNLVIEARAQLDSLGPSRQTFMDQRQFLTRLAVRYQRSVTDSLTGNNDSTWESDDPRKLRMHLQMNNDMFSKRMTQRGHTRMFRLVDGEINREFAPFVRKDEENIYSWIRRVYRESRGSELPGTVNPTVLENMFRQQSEKWNEIATRHVTDTEGIISRFNKAVFQDVFYEDTLRDKMESRNDVAFRKATQDAASQLAAILADERGGILQTVNYYFADTLAATRQDRVLKRLQKLGPEDGNVITVNLKSLASTAHLSNEDQAVNDVHDILKAYYKVALRRFTDNVVIQVVERIISAPKVRSRTSRQNTLGACQIETWLTLQQRTMRRHPAGMTSPLSLNGLRRGRGREAKDRNTLYFLFHMDAKPGLPLTFEALGYFSLNSLGVSCVGFVMGLHLVLPTGFPGV